LEYGFVCVVAEYEDDVRTMRAGVRKGSRDSLFPDPDSEDVSCTAGGAFPVHSAASSGRAFPPGSDTLLTFRRAVKMTSDTLFHYWACLIE
jgi:hypothetical protein